MKVRLKHMPMLIAFLLAAAMAMTMPLSALAAEEIVGDINNDGELSQADLDYLNGVIDGTQQLTAACDVNGNNMIDSDDVVVLKHLIDPESPALNDPDDLLFGAESDNLQALVVRGDSTQALKIDAGNTAMVTFESALDWSGQFVLSMDTLLVGCDKLEFQVAISTDAGTQTDNVTVYAAKAAWSTAYMDLPSGCSNVTGLKITVPEMDGVSVYLDQFKVYSTKHPETENVLISNGQSDYVVVIPSNASLGESAAANRLVKHLSTATGTTLSIITDAEYTEGKALFIGNTAQTQSAGITVDATQLGLSGHIVKTIGENCYLVGATSSGNHFAVTTFLKNTIGYAMYDSNEVTLVKASKVNLRYFGGEPQLPSIENRPKGSGANMRTEYSYANMVADSGWLTPRDSVNAWHNSLDFLPPSEFADNHPLWYASDCREVCFTAHGDEVEHEAMVDEVVNVIIAAAEAKPSVNRMTFTMQDASYWCDCSACTDCEETYGAKTASCIILFNRIMDKVNTYMDENMDGRRITLYFFSYLVAQNAPVVWDEATNMWVPTSDEVVPHEGVGVMCAPLHADYAYPLNHFKNETYYTILQQWKDMGLPIAYWVYNLNYTSNFMPTNTFATDVANYPLFEDAGVVWLYNQGQWQNTALTAFNHLKEFLQSQLAWDAHCDTEELTDNYFEAQFKNAEPAMRQFYDALRQRLDYCTQTLGISGDIADSGMYTEEAFPEEIINGYMDYIHAALEAIEPLKSTDAETYILVYNRIIAESLFPRFYQITLYGDSYDSATRTEMMSAFKADCEAVGFNYSSLYVEIDNLWKEWGIGEIDLTPTGMHDVDLSTGDAISLTVEGLTGTIKGISVDSGEMIAVADGNMNLAGNTLTVSKTVWESLGLGEHTLYVHTKDNIYKLNITVATKVIASYADLKAIKNFATESGTVVDGYFVLSADITATDGAAFEIAGWTSAHTPELGFVGTLDGRGHAISNMNTGNGLFFRLGKGTVRNLALLNVTGSRVLGTACFGSTIENVVITGSGCTVVADEFGYGATVNNCLAILSDGSYFTNVGGVYAGAAVKYSNIYTVMGNASGDKAGLCNGAHNSSWTNCAGYADINALIDAGTVGPCTVADDQMFYGSHMIAQAVVTEVDLTSTGIHDVDLSTGDAISLTVEGLTGTIKGISVDNGEMIAVADGNMSMAGNVLTVSKTVWESLGLGEHTLYVHTTERNVYKLNITVATKVITTYNDLAAMKNNLSGYYVMSADIDAAAEAYLEIGNFAGTLDGRGHVVKNLKVWQGGLFNTMGAATVKNLALLDVVNNHATNGAALAWGVSGAKLENLVITSDNCVKVVEEMNTGATATNLLVIMPQGKFVVTVGSPWSASSAYTNVYTVMGNASGEKAGLCNGVYSSTWTNCASYADTNALIEAGTVGPCTLVDGQVLYGNHLIAEAAKVEVDLTTTGMHDVDLSTGDAISLTVEGLTGTLQGISADNGQKVAVADGNMSLAGNVLTVSKTVWESLGLGEHTLYVYTAKNIYKLNITVATKVITTYNDLAAMKNNLSGYYVMSADIDAAAEAYLEINNFAGTLDGRGHAVSNLKVYQGGLFMNLKAAAVKNLALLNVVTSHATNGAALAWYVTGTDLENLVITSDNCVKVVEEMNTVPTATNCLVIMPNGQHFVNVSGLFAHDPSVYTNVYTVMGQASGDQPGLSNHIYQSTWNSCASYADTDALIQSGNVAPCTVVGGTLYYGDHIIAIRNYDLVAGETAVLEAPGMTGTLQGVSVNDGEMVAVADGNMSLANNQLTITSEVLQSFGMGKHTLYVHTSDKVYPLSIMVATLFVSNAEELKAISNDLSGYYVLDANIDAADAGHIEISNFAGTLDGCGHAVSNLHVYQGGLFNTMGAATIKNLALLDVVNAHITNGAALAWGVSGANLENLVITSDNCVKVVEELNTGATATNLLVIMPQGKFVVTVGSPWAAASAYTNVYTVMGNASGEKAGLCNGAYSSTWTNCANYADVATLLTNVQNGTAQVPDCTVENNALYWNGISICQAS